MAQYEGESVREAMWVLEGICGPTSLQQRRRKQGGDSHLQLKLHAPEAPRPLWQETLRYEALESVMLRHVPQYHMTRRKVMGVIPRLAMHVSFHPVIRSHVCAYSIVTSRVLRALSLRRR